MTLPVSNVVEQMSQLDAARNLVLGDAAFYPQIVSGIIPIIARGARLELRRWGADFLAETFASPAFAEQPKQKLSTEVLQTVQELLDSPEDDMPLIRSAVQTAASIYPLVFRHVVDHPEDSSTWEQMTAIKRTILKKWDMAPQGCKICCIKFVQKVVQVQTQGEISDPRRPEKNETSIAIVPRNHPLLILPNIEAETSGLLDRLLNVFYETSSDPLLVNATLNCLAVLIRTRPSIANKILETILNFNPLNQANPPITPVLRVNIKSMERTARTLLVNVLKSTPNHSLAGRMQQYIDRLSQSRSDILEEAPKKRALPTEPTDVVDSAKRARLGVDTPPQLRIPPLPDGPVSVAQLFTLTEDIGLTTFDVKQLPLDLVVKIVVPVLSRVDPESLDQAIGAVRSRYLTLCKKQAFEHKLSTPQAAVEPEEDDDYEPEYQPMDVAAAPDSSHARSSAPRAQEVPPDFALGPFVLPPPPALSPEEASQLGNGTIERIFTMITTLDQPKVAKESSQSVGFGRLAANSFDRDSWLTLLTRLATRASAGLDSDGTSDGTEYERTSEGSLITSAQSCDLADRTRETFYRYVVEDFRARINSALSWLNEEWYNDQIQLKRFVAEHGTDVDTMEVPKHYDRWVMRLLEGILPYLDARDKVLIRFLSEIPQLNPALIDKVKTLANDPERVNLCVQALHYLVLVRPPARELCLEALEDLYQKVEEARPSITKILQKWRPHPLLEEQRSQTPSSHQQQSQAASAGSAGQGEATVSPLKASHQQRANNTTEIQEEQEPQSLQEQQQEPLDGALPQLKT